jgi:tRNA G46 methylase TrmB
LAECASRARTACSACNIARTSARTLSSKGEGEASLCAFSAKKYLSVHGAGEEAISFYRERCRSSTSVLEVGCGDGRILYSIAKTRSGGNYTSENRPLVLMGA